MLERASDRDDSPCSLSVPHVDLKSWGRRVRGEEVPGLFSRWIGLELGAERAGSC